MEERKRVRGALYTHAELTAAGLKRGGRESFVWKGDLGKKERKKSFPKMESSEAAK